MRLIAPLDIELSKFENVKKIKTPHLSAPDLRSKYLGQIFNSGYTWLLLSSAFSALYAYTFQLSLVPSFSDRTATLFRHRLNKLNIQLSMGIHKIVTEHFR